MLLAFCNCVVVLALPVKLPVTLPVRLPVTLPVTFPVNAAVTVLALKLPLPFLFTNVLAVLLEVAASIVWAIWAIVEEFTPPILLDELDILETTKAAVATSVPLARSEGVGAVTVPVKEGEDIVGDTIVLFDNVSFPAKVAIVPVVGKVTVVGAVLTNVVLKLPEVVNALAVVIFPPKVIVLPVLLTPVPPNSPVIADVKLPVPSNELPYIVLAFCNCVVVLALPAKLPVTFPVTFPINAEVIVPALKLPLPSLWTKVLGVFVEVAEATLELIVVMVEELTPPTVFTIGRSAVPPKSPASFIIPSVLADAFEAWLLVILESTNAAVATSVPAALLPGVVAVGVPVKEGDEIVGDSIVLFFKVSEPSKVARTPVVGKVTFVVPILVKVVLNVPAVVNALAVVILPPKLIVLVPLFTPVPP